METQSYLALCARERELDEREQSLGQWWEDSADKWRDYGMELNAYYMGQIGHLDNMTFWQRVRFVLTGHTPYIPPDAR